MSSLYRRVFLSLLVACVAGTASLRLGCPAWAQLASQPSSCCSEKADVQDSCNDQGSCCDEGACLCRPDSPPTSSLAGPVPLPLEVALSDSEVVLCTREEAVRSTSHPDSQPYAQTLLPARRSRAPPLA